MANPFTISSQATAPSMGTRAVSPTTKVTKPSTTLPKGQAVPTPASAGTYNNVNITPGTDAEIAAQVAKINANTPAAKTPTYPGLMGAQIQAKDQATTSAPVSTPAPAPVVPPTPPTYTGTVGNLVQASNPNQQQQNATTALTGASAPNTTQTGLLNSLQKVSGQNTAIGQNAQNIANRYGQQIADVGLKGNQFEGGQLTTGTSPVASGNAAVTAQTTAAQQQALAQGEEAALQGVGYQLTGQGQLQSGLTSALGGANTQQAQQLSGLGAASNSLNTQQAQQLSGLNSAAGYAQPQLGSIGQVPFNPLNQDQGQILGTQQPGGVQAAGNLLGQFAGSQAVGAAPGQTAATNYQNLGTAETAGQAAGIQAVNAVPGTTQAGQYGQIAQYKSAAQQGEQLASQLSDLISKFGLNPSDINAVNSGFQKIAANTSDPRYQTLSNYLNDVASRYAQVLTPPGGSATDMTRSIAASMLNATASGKSIQQVLAALGQQAQAVISAVPATGTVPGATSQYKEGQSTSAGGYNFVFQNGKWVPK